ncbi:hypothetical protein Celaphus_00011741, partial [Cervus elaphus hippelaphus]
MSSVTSLPGCGSAFNLFYSLLVSRQAALRQWSPPLGPVRSPGPPFLPWLAELKQECLARGLETKGIKQDLINRLQAYLEEHAEEEANEEDVLGDETERMQKRAERFNVPVSLESKKAARAARFGISPVPSKGLSSDTKPMVNLDKLKERAQRFGLNVSSISRK